MDGLTHQSEDTRASVILGQGWQGCGMLEDKACIWKISKFVVDGEVLKLRTNLQSQIEMRCEVLSTAWQTNETFAVIIGADIARER